METALNIQGSFSSTDELRDVIRQRKICYDTAPYYAAKKGGLLQIGFELNLYGTFPDEKKDYSPDDPEFREVLRDVRRLAESLSKTCNPLHMCDAAIIDSNTITYPPERKMRPEVTVHIPVFDQKNFGHPVDDSVTASLHTAERMLQAAGVKKNRWTD